jgi:hypothetical protein
LSVMWSLDGTVGKWLMEEVINLEEVEKYLKEHCQAITVKFFPETGRYGMTKRLLFHYTLLSGPICDVETGYDKRWCYDADVTNVEKALAAWNGNGDPEGWHRDPNTGRRRPNGDATKQYIEW